MTISALHALNLQLLATFIVQTGASACLFFQLVRSCVRAHEQAKHVCLFCNQTDNFFKFLPFSYSNLNLKVKNDSLAIVEQHFSYTLRSDQQLGDFQQPTTNVNISVNKS